MTATAERLTFEAGYIWWLLVEHPNAHFFATKYAFAVSLFQNANGIEIIVVGGDYRNLFGLFLIVIGQVWLDELKFIVDVIS